MLSAKPLSAVAGHAAADREDGSTDTTLGHPTFAVIEPIRTFDNASRSATRPTPLGA